MRLFKIIILLLFSGCFFISSVYGELIRDVDEFDGGVRLESITSIISTYYEENKMHSVMLSKSDNFDTYEYILMLTYGASESYIFSHSDLDIKINDTDIINAEYIYQKPEYVSYYPTNQVLNIVLFSFSEDVVNRISQAKTVTLRAGSDVGDIVYEVPEDMLREWNWVIDTPYNPECVNGKEYQSKYKVISWGCRESDDFYSFDILSSNGMTVLHPAAKTGKNLHSFYPQTDAIYLEPGNYTWKIWTPFGGYGGKGFEGKFTVPKGKQNSYRSTYEMVSWGNRGGDIAYCIDICDANWNIYDGFQALKCGDFFHDWSPKQYLNGIGIPDGTAPGFKFYWRVWSPGGYGGVGFEGSVTCK